MKIVCDSIIKQHAFFSYFILSGDGDDRHGGGGDGGGGTFILAYHLRRKTLHIYIFFLIQTIITETRYNIKIK